MNKPIRSWIQASALTLAMTAASAAFAAPSGTVAFLMPDQASTRYEQHDFPGFKAEMAKLCPDCTVIYQNANADVSLQQQQFNSVIAAGREGDRARPGRLDRRRLAGQDGAGARASRSSPTTGRSRRRRPTTTSRSTTRASARRSPSRSSQHLKDEGVPTDKGGVLQINGSPTDAAAGLIRDGIHAGLEGSGYKTLAEFDTPDWAPPKAQEWVSGPDHALRRRDRRRRRGQRRHRRRRDRGVQGGRRRTRCRRSPATTRPSRRCSSSSRATSTTRSPSRPRSSRAAAAKVAVGFLNGETPEGRDDALRHAVAALRAGGGHAEEHQGRDLRQGHRDRRGLCTGRYAEGCTKLGISRPN